MILSYPAALLTISGTLSIHISWVEGILFPVYFVLGYLLYASLFAGLAASCETEQELQMYTPLAALPIWLSFSLIWLVINDPNSVWSVAASLFPATAPIIMMLRLGSEMPPYWQFAASIAHHDRQHLGRPLDLVAPLPRRHPDVRQARDPARADPLAPLQLKRGNGCPILASSSDGARVGDHQPIRP